MCTSLLWPQKQPQKAWILQISWGSTSGAVCFTWLGEIPICILLVKSTYFSSSSSGSDKEQEVDKDETSPTSPLPPTTDNNQSSQIVEGIFGETADISSWVFVKYIQHM